MTSTNERMTPERLDRIRVIVDRERGLMAHLTSGVNLGAVRELFDEVTALTTALAEAKLEYRREHAMRLEDLDDVARLTDDLDATRHEMKKLRRHMDDVYDALNLQVQHHSDDEIAPKIQALRASFDATRRERDETERRRDVAESKAAIMSRQIDRYLPCPDHRDKIDGSCYVCTAERATRERDETVDMNRQLRAKLTEVMRERDEAERLRDNADGRVAILVVQLNEARAAALNAAFGGTNEPR